MRPQLQLDQNWDLDMDTEEDPSIIEHENVVNTVNMEIPTNETGEI